jgi:hypothetical protein
MARTSGGDNSQTWHSVIVVTRGNACPDALAVRNQRFLSKDAPTLPLKDCPHAGTCKCIYRHFSDRRDDARRSEDAIGVRTATPKTERRIGRGRRKSDHEIG